jgi:hypothetical protein
MDTPPQYPPHKLTKEAMKHTEYLDFPQGARDEIVRQYILSQPPYVHYRAHVKKMNNLVKSKPYLRNSFNPVNRLQIKLDNDTLKHHNEALRPDPAIIRRIQGRKHEIVFI